MNMRNKLFSILSVRTIKISLREFREGRGLNFKQVGQPGSSETVERKT